MAEEIQWQRGKFHKFYAQMKIRVGGKEDTSILAGDEFEFDGTILKYAGLELPSTSTRGAVREGWATLAQGKGGHIPAFVANRSVAKSQTQNRDLSRVQRTEPRQMSTDHLDEETVLEVGDRRAVQTKDERGRPVGHLNQNNNRRTAGQRSMAVTQSDIDQQDHTTISRIRTSANIGAVDVTKNPGLARDLENIEYDKGFGRTERQTEGVTIRTNVGSVSKQIREDSDEGTVVGQVRHTSNGRSSEGVSVRDTSGSRRPKPQRGPQGPGPEAAPRGAMGANGPAGPSGPSTNGKPAKANGKKVAPQREVDLSKLPAKIRMARRIDPQFPLDWSFTGKLAERMAAVKKHGATPTFLEALYAAEGDQMRKTLEKEFPKQFSA